MKLTTFLPDKDEFRANLSGDIKGGIAAGVVTLPIALAFGQASGLGAVAGLIGSIVMGITAIFLGGTKTQISSPVGVLLITTILIVNQELGIAAKELGLAQSDIKTLQYALPSILFIFFLSGLILTILGLFKIGNYINYIPYPVVSGFSTGIGLLIIIIQLKDLFNLTFEKYDKFTVVETEALIKMEHGLLIAGLTLLIIIVLPKFFKLIPSSLVALIMATLMPLLLGWENIPKITVPDSIVLSTYPDLFLGFMHGETISRGIVLAITVALLSAINTLLTSVVADNMTGQKHDSNRELLSQGIGNTIGALFGSIPVSGAVACTGTNINYGGRTKISGIVSTLFLVLVFFLASSLIKFIPKSVLDGILIYVGYVIIDKNALKKIKFMPLIDNIIMFLVVFLTIYGELMYAVIGGLALASLYFMKKMADVVELGTEASKADKVVSQLIDTFPDADDFRKSVIIKSINGPIFFGFSSRFSKIMSDISVEKAVVLNLGNVPFIDQSGLYTLERVIKQLKQKNISMQLSEVSDENKVLLENIGVIPNIIKQENIFPSVEEAIMFLHEKDSVENNSNLHNGLYIPSAFTPNEDGVKDTWEIKNITNFPNCTVEIFTLEGQKIFHSEGYRQPWEGLYQEEKLPSGNYKYLIDLGEKEDDKIEGNVAIIRG